MMLTREEIKDFKRLVLEAYSVVLTDEQALDQGSRLVQLFELLLKHKMSPLGIEKSDGKVQNNG